MLQNSFSKVLQAKKRSFIKMLFQAKTNFIIIPRTLLQAKKYRDIPSVLQQA